MTNWAERLNGMRHVGDDYGDTIVRSILGTTTPEEVDAHLVDLIAEIRSPETGFPGGTDDVENHRRARELGERLEDAQFWAGTSSVLQGLKVARETMKAVEVAFRHHDAETARGFIDQTVETLEDARAGLARIRQRIEEGDPHAWYGPHHKREAYNRLLMLSEYLAFAPELKSAPESHLAWHFSMLPDGFSEYFGPVPAPDWVDAKKLERATAVWDDSMLYCLLVLFSGSLPYCYLDKKGIPLLYETGKLADSKYISQRLYETGLMLDAVMSKDGIRVGHDVSHQRFRLEEAAAARGIVLRFDRQGNPIWSELDEAERASIQQAVRDLADGNETSRFLSGKGILYARKVRLLHAAMRYMAMQHATPPPAEDASARARWMARFAGSGWNPETDGIPINQEDMAYTLLTFSWVIPQGLKAWGREPEPEELEAFLHTWKVVGYVMGIHEDLLTDDPAEARRLFDTLVAQLADQPAHDAHKPTEERMSVVLTGTIIRFLQDYLPKPLARLPAVMIEDQVGREHSEDLIAPDLRPGFFARLFYGVVTRASRFHAFLTRFVYRHSPTIRAYYAELMHKVGMAFVESWRGPFERRPFYLPETLSQWAPDPDVRERYETRLQQWRHRMFNMLALGLFALLGGSAVVGAGIVGAVILDGVDVFERSLLFSVPLFVGSVLLMRHMVEKTAHERPRLDTADGPPRIYPDR